MYQGSSLVAILIIASIVGFSLGYFSSFDFHYFYLSYLHVICLFCIFVVVVQQQGEEEGIDDHSESISIPSLEKPVSVLLPHHLLGFSRHRNSYYRI